MKHTSWSFIAISAVILCCLFALAPAQVATAANLCVNPGGTSGCFSTIQAAVNAAAPGDTINVAAGTYPEQVTITKSVHLVGAGAGVTTIQAPATLPDASQPTSFIVIFSGGGVSAELTGFTVAGPGPSGCGSIRGGIFVRDGANANIHDNTVTDIRDNPFGGCQNGVAIWVGRQAWSTVGTATIEHNVIVNYQKGGIVVDNTGSNALITNNTITGAGLTSVTAQNGIQISRGATATLGGNTVSGASYYGADTSSNWGACGILLYQSGPVTLTGGNHVFNNDQNLDVTAGSGAVTLGAETFGPVSTAPVGLGFDIYNETTNPINATGVTFAGAADNFAIENLIYHRVNDPTTGLVTWVAGNLFVTPTSGTIQAAIDAANAGDTVNIAPGTYTEDVNLNKRVTILGAGSGTDGTIVTNPTGGDYQIGVFQVTASGLSDSQPVKLQNLRIQPVGLAGISVGRFTQSTGVNVRYLALDNVFVVGTNTNPCTEQERGLYVDLTSSVQHLTIHNSAFNNLTYGWYFQKAVSADVSTVRYVTVDNTTFNHNNSKGIYAEKLSDATFTNVTVDGNGFGPASDMGGCSYFLPTLTGMDINLKAGTYQNLVFNNLILTNNALGTQKGAGLAIKARDDGSYSSFPATLNNVQVNNSVVTGNERGIRLGEPGKNNAGPTGVKLFHNQVTGNVHTYPGSDGSPYGGFVNESQASANVEANWWGSVTGPSRTGAGAGELIYGSGDFDPWCGDAECSFLVTFSGGRVVIPAGTSASDIQAIINAAPSGTTIVFPPETIGGTGAFTIPHSGLTILLPDGTVIQNSSPCFDVNASDTTITTESIGGAKCVPTSGANGINVAAGLSNIVLYGFEIDGAAGTDGVHYAGAIANTQVVNLFIHNLAGVGVNFTVAPSGVVDLQGNLFKANASFGVSSPADLNVAYNSWASMTGPAHGPNGVSAAISTFSPWTYADLSMVSSGSPVADKVAVGSTITYTVKLNAQNVTGADFQLLYPASKLSIAGTVAGTVFNPYTFDISTPGVIRFHGLAGFPPAPVSGSNLTLFSVTFTALAPDATPGNLNLDETSDAFAMSPNAGPSNNIYANALTDSTVTIFSNFAVTATVSTQGRMDRSGIQMFFSTGLFQGYGPYQATSTNTLANNVSFSSVVADTYTITTHFARYLNVTIASGKSKVISALASLAGLELKGGDANGDDAIDIGDAGIIGGQYGNSGSSLNGDINYSGTVDIFDLALMGGNYGLTSATAYATWVP